MSNPEDQTILKGLYPIIDLECLSNSHSNSNASAARVAEVILDAGGGRINILQLRAKGQSADEIFTAAKEIRSLKSSFDFSFIINDRIDIALMSNADGVHLGQNDIPLGEARKLLGNNKILGLSTQNAAEAQEAKELGADYISLGPIFKTRTKLDARTPQGLDGLSNVAETLEKNKLPIVAIGGITKETIAKVSAAGASMAALISEILLAEDIGSMVAQLIKKIGPPPTPGQEAKE